MQDAQAKAPTPAQGRQLNRYLQSAGQPEGTLNLMSLKGYLYATCTTPQLLQPGAWLPGIFAGQDPALESERDSWHLQTILQLYNQINTQVLEERCKLPQGCSLPDNVLEAFQPGSGLHDWSLGFSVGVSWFRKDWDAVAEHRPDTVDSLWSLWPALMLFAMPTDAQLVQEMLDGDESLDSLARRICSRLPMILNYYAFQSRCCYEQLVEEGKESLVDMGSDDAEAEPPGRDSDSDNEFFECMELGLQTQDRETAWAAAKRALELRPDSLEALNLLADTELRLPQKIELLEQAVEQGEAQLGEAFFKEHAGHFWGLMETRPYMQALASLAQAYADNKQRDKAITCYRRCLDLNPNDNQAIRYVLLPLYLEAQQLTQAEALMDEYADDQSAFMLYSRALLCYMREGDSVRARELKKAAIAYNKHVPKLLAGHSKMPKQLPNFFGLGDKNEAVLMVDTHQKAWRQVVGAIGWLLKKA